jgi:cell division control protein 24
MVLFRHLFEVYPPEHEFYQELEEGLAACKRIGEKCNEAERQAANAATIKMLEQQVDNWRGLTLADFGELLLNGTFVVKRSDVDLKYQVFLFKKIILFCKYPATHLNRSQKGGKNDSIWKKISSKAFPITPRTESSKTTTTLLLKGRIFLNTVTHAVPITKGGA